MVLENNSDKMQKSGADGSQSSELVMPQLARTVSALLPSPPALTWVESGIPWSTRLDMVDILIRTLGKLET